MKSNNSDWTLLLVALHGYLLAFLAFIAGMAGQWLVCAVLIGAGSIYLYGSVARKHFRALKWGTGMIWGVLVFAALFIR